MRRELAALIDSARRRGAFATLRLLASELAFDLRHGTETRRVLEGSQLGPLSGDRSSEDLVYHAVNPLVLDQALREIAAREHAPPWAGSFVDFGSGKGRALIVAASRGFDTVVGVECSRSLHAAASQNLGRAWRRRGLRARYDLRCEYAESFDVPDDSLVWFWFNPFGPEAVERVAGRLLASVTRRPRAAYLVYANPVHAGLLLRRGFRTVAEVRCSPTHLDVLVLKVA
jgi:SAM-dependent methyltransferase